MGPIIGEVIVSLGHYFGEPVVEEAAKAPHLPRSPNPRIRIRTVDRDFIRSDGRRISRGCGRGASGSSIKVLEKKRKTVIR